MATFDTPQDIMLAATEELGEVAREVALLERSGTKAGWEREGSKDRLKTEIGHLRNVLDALEAHYD